MKKNIFIVFLLIVTLSLFIYAFIKANEAEKAGLEATIQRDIAEELRQEANYLRMEAENQAAQAKMQASLANQLRTELEACRAK